MNRYIVSAACVAAVFSCWTFVAHRADRPVHEVSNQKHILVIIPSYNNATWYTKNLDSVINQEYENYRIIYIDDNSSDGTVSKVAQYIKDKGCAARCTLIANKSNAGAMANIYNAVHTCAHDDEIVITLDGDDWLAHNGVFEVINKAYADPQVWMTYGNYTHWPQQSFGSTCGELPQVVIDQHAYRRYPWKTSHLRTFYAWLFKKIKKEDLCDTAGFYRVTWDQAFMFPMLEMAAGRWHYIPDILYVYNVQNPLNDFKVRLRQQLAAEREIRSKTPYQPLQKP
jgi:glycosyltransferase involved in cell wall biosynthesis